MANHWGPKDQCIQEIYSNVRSRNPPFSSADRLGVIVKHCLRVFCICDTPAPTNNWERGDPAADGTSNASADTGIAVNFGRNATSRGIGRVHKTCHAGEQQDSFKDIKIEQIVR
jgi:hypothetical protein